MLGLCYDKLPKVVWWFFTSLKRGREPERVMKFLSRVRLACVASVFQFRTGGGKENAGPNGYKKRHQLRMTDIMQLVT